MARGLLTGALFFLSITLVSIIMILWPDSPWSTWLMEKTELGDDFCWFGEGIWRTNMVWGQSSKDMHCVKHGTQEVDAVDFYCERDAAMASMFDPAGRMCDVTKWGRFFMSFGAVTSFIGVALVVAVHFTTSLETRALRIKRAILVQLIAFASHLAVFLLMSASPLFDTYHFRYLGKDNRVNYKGLGCVFQSPFVGGPLSILYSSPLKCIYPGPALPLTIGIVIFQFMALWMLFFLYRDTRARIRHSPEQSLDVILEEEEPLQRAEDEDEDLVLVNKMDASDPVYSLHGAFLRRLSKFHRLEQNLLGVSIPIIALGNGMLLVSWFYHGMQFLVHVRVHNQTLPPRSEDEYNATTALDGIGINQYTIVELREQVFTFDPVTSLKNFWEGQGYLLTIVTAVWLDFFPFMKIFLWHFYWFVPQSEVRRGRVLTWIDYLGKWSLANLFCLCIISVGFLFKSTIFLPIPLPLRQSIVLELECVVESGAGVTWFIVCMLWTVGLGGLFLHFHTLARTWEEERRGNSSKTAARQPLLRPLRSGNINAGAFEDDTPIPTPSLLSSSNDSNNNSRAQEDSSQGSTGSSQYVDGVPPRRASLFREIVRRTSAQFLVVSTRVIGVKQPLFHSSFTPIRHQRHHKFSFKGRLAMWCALSALLALVIVALFFVPVLRFHKMGAVPDVLLNSREAEFSVVQLAFGVAGMGASARPAYELALVFGLFALVFPVLHGVTLFFLWGYPLSVGAQLQLFRFVEFCDAWNALDVFFLAGVVVYIGLESISKSVVEIVVPGLTAVVRTFFGESDIYVITPHLSYGFWCIFVALFGQKLVSYILMELTAATIAQRQFAVKRGEMVTGANGQRRCVVSEDNQAQPSGANSPSQGHQQNLSPEHLVMFSPAARYVGVSGVDSAMIYAGLPRWIWRVGVAMGLMEIEEE